MIYPKPFLREHFSAVGETLGDLDNDAIFAATALLKRAQSYLDSVFMCGNGGSAATASHFANDLMKMAGINAICLNDMTPTMLAYMNDDGVGSMFAKPFATLKNPGDILVAISCSGNSENIIKVVETALLFSTQIILLTGDEGGELAKIANVVIKVPHPDIKVQEDVHLAVCHAIVGALAEEWA